MAPAADDGARHAGPGAVGQLPAAVLGAPQRAPVQQVGEEFLDQVRAAVAAFDEVLDQRRREFAGRVLQDGGGQRGHLGGRQRREFGDGRGAAALGGPYQFQRRARFGPQGREQQDRQARQVVDQVLQDGDGLGVGVVEVLQQQDAALVAAEHREQPEQRLGEFDHRLGVGTRAGRRCGVPPLGDEPGERGAVGGEFGVGGGTGGPEP